MSARACLRTWLALLALIVLAACSNTGGADLDSADFVALGATGPHSFTVIPPGPVAEGTDVELRLAVKNRSNKAREYRVEFAWTEGSTSETIATAVVQLEGKETKLVKAWWASEGNSGSGNLSYRVTQERGPVESNRWPIEVVSNDTSALPLLQAGWLDPGALIPGVYPQDREPDARYVRDVVDAMNEIGMKTIIVTYVEYILNGWGGFYPSSIPELQPSPVDFDVINTILNQAAKNGQHVFLGTGRGDDLYLTFLGFDDPERVSRAVDFGKEVADELWERYGHYPSFYGWYITHEANDIAGASAYYNPMADYLHSLSPDKAVMVAPAGTPIVSTEALANSSVDIFAYQDAVGAGYIPYVYTFNPELRIAMLDSIYSHYREMHLGTGKHLWSDLELWEMAGPAYAASYPADWERVSRQLDIEKNYVEMITAYEFFGMMEHSESQVRLGGDKAVELYTSYKNYYEQYLQSRTP